MKRFLLFLSFVFFSLNIYSQTDSVLIWADKMPEFNGGLQALNDSIISNIAKENVVFDGIRTGTINLKTIVLKNGTVGEVEVVRGIDSVFDIAASNAVKKLTGFSPGMQNGQPVNVYYSFPLKIIVDSSVQSQRQPNIETLPEYPGGVVQLKEDIDANLFYPKVAKRKNIQGCEVYCYNNRRYWCCRISSRSSSST